MNELWSSDKAIWERDMKRDTDYKKKGCVMAL